MLDRLRAEDEVELAVTERERRVGVELDEPRLGPEPPAGALEGDARDVGRGQVRCVQLSGEGAVPAAQVECPLGPAQRADEVAEVPGRLALTVRHELPELVVVAATHGRSA